MTAANKPGPGDPILGLRELSVSRGGAFSVSVSKLDLHVGEVGALVGPSGCGKTTLALGWTGLFEGLEVRGERWVFGDPWPVADTAAWHRMLAGKVTLILQDAKAALDPLARIGEQIAAFTTAPAKDRNAALRSLGIVDPARLASLYPHQISGGQAQKVLLAVALLRAPRLLICDEPTASLDGDSIDELIRGLRLLQEQHQTAILLATHDMSLVKALGARVWRHVHGVFVAASGTEESWAAVERQAVSETVLEVSGVHKSFGDLSVLRDLSLTVARGEVVAIVGPSGCGKTTLARILSRHIEADAGSVVGEGVQMLFQDALAALTPHRTIRRLVDETRVEGFDVEKEAAALGLPLEKLRCRPAELSGGERRRAGLLRTLSVEPPVLVLDEPTASLDHASAVQVMELVAEVQRRRSLACVLISHDEAMAESVAHRVLRLREGRLS